MRVSKYLNAMGIDHINEYNFDRFSVDIYVPDFHVAIEVDGPSHLAKKDSRRDATLRERCALPVLHIKAGARKYINLLDIQTVVVEFLKEHEDTAKERLEKYRQWQASH